MLQASNIILAPALHVFHVTNVSQQSTAYKTIPILSTPYHQTLNWHACKFPRYIYSNMSNTTTPKYMLLQRLVWIRNWPEHMHVLCYFVLKLHLLLPHCFNPLSTLNQSDRSWQLWIRSSKWIENLTTSLHCFYKKHMGTRKENLYFDIGGQRVSTIKETRFHHSISLSLSLSLSLSNITTSLWSLCRLICLLIVLSHLWH